MLSSNTIKTTAAIRAELIADSATAAGFTAHGPAPVLALCRMLVAAGIDSDQPLHAYRGNMLCLTACSIGEAAKLELNSKGTGFVQCRQAVRTGPPIAPKSPTLVVSP